MSSSVEFHNWRLSVGFYCQQLGPPAGQVEHRPKFQAKCREQICKTIGNGDEKAGAAILQRWQNPDLRFGKGYPPLVGAAEEPVTARQIQELFDAVKDHDSVAEPSFGELVDQGCYPQFPTGWCYNPTFTLTLGGESSPWISQQAGDAYDPHHTLKPNIRAEICALRYLLFVSWLGEGGSAPNGA